MLLEFGARNFYSFKEGFEVSMRLGDSCPNKISKGKSYANVLAIKGANASGKTNVLKVFWFLKYFILDSFNQKPSEDLFFDSFFNNSKPTDIYIIFLDNKIEYRYELKITTKKILSETLYRKDKRDTKIIERKNNKIIFRIDEFRTLDIMKLRDNASLVSTANQYAIDEIKIIYNLFEKFVSNVLPLGRDNYFFGKDETSKFYFNNQRVFQFVKNILAISDTGIKDISIEKDKNMITKEITYYPLFHYDINAKNNFLLFENQSSGIQALFLQLGLYKTVLDIGGVLILDEFDINLHPDLLPMLIDFFDDEEKNPNNAQLIFTTHHTDIMDKLGKYRVVLVNKEDNESYLYRLDEIQGDILRNDRSIVQKYKEGKIGGKPRLMI